MIVGSYVIYSLIDYLFVAPKKNGEDALVLTLTPRVKRIDLFVSKSLAYISALAVFSLLTFAIPFGVILLLAKLPFPWAVYSLLIL